jgi:Ca-activated chloride channel family protein
VVFASHATKVLDPVSLAQRERILAAIDGLHAEGSTNVDAGLTMGYEMAAGACIAKGNNRVILCSDGVANTGATEQAQILANVARYRAEGILLNCVGVGMGNHNDALLEQLADRGDGQCVYVDRLEEARRTFLDNLDATLQTVARDVKIQVEFDPARVVRYRQLGYENRELRNQDFRNDQVDAGEVGAGHEVVALYEIKLRPNVAGPLLDIRVRAKDADVPGEVSEIHRSVDASEIKASFEVANPRFQLSAVAGEFAEQLRESYWTHGRTLAGLFPLAERVARGLPDDHDVLELCALIRGAAELERTRPDELAQAIELVKHNNFARSQLATQTSAASQDELSKLNAQSEELRRTVEAILEKR